MNTTIAALNTPTDPSDSYHYGVIARAIALIDQAAPRQLSLGELATALNMSEAHFQRLFSAWVGVSPKRYQQYLALGQAKSLLSGNCTTLETAHHVGLSGSGRLHDLFLRWEAMSPGDYARQGAGLVIRWTWIDSPYGEALVMASDKGICGLGFSADCGREAAMADLISRWPKAKFTQDDSAITPLLAGAWDGRDAPLSLHLMGAPFQIKVWEALLSVPDGSVTTYSHIASAIGHPKAVRAVGTAVGRNPISWLIPCHRVLRKSGGLGGYHWGLPVKRALLARESARAEASDST